MKLVLNKLLENIFLLILFFLFIKIKVNAKAFIISKIALIMLNLEELISDSVKYVIKLIIHPNKAKNSTNNKRQLSLYGRGEK